MSILIQTPYSIRLGVAGAGTMGSGIALSALLANMFVTLYDVSPEVLERAREYIEKHLARKDRGGQIASLQLTNRLEDLAGAGVLIEAAPEDLALKCSLFSRLDQICPSPAILATNTSTLPVTAIAAAVATPERVAGMHFFNPAAMMPLVEVIRAPRTSQETVRALLALAEMLGKKPVVVSDTPGFIVNRVAVPFFSEALRLLGDRVASSAQIDRLARMAGSFHMGPFQLMDLIGIDINLAASQSIYEQFYGEPRYRPHPIQSQIVQQKALGRKTGRGFYDYLQPQSDTDPEPPRRIPQTGHIHLSAGSWAPGLSELCRQVGYTAGDSFSRQPNYGLITRGRNEGLQKSVISLERSLPPEIPLLVQCVDVTLTEIATWLEYPERLVGFDGLFFANGTAATLVASPTLNPYARSGTEKLVTSLGRLPVWVQDSPALVLPRLVCTLANEAAFAVAEGVADTETIDKAMQLGMNFPRGPLSWAKAIGYGRVVEVLDHLRSEFGEERYRAAYSLRRWSRFAQISV